MKLMDYEQYLKFAKRLKESEPAVKLVGAYLEFMGWDVRIPELVILGPNDNWEDFVDDGDLYASYQGSEWHRMEVKHNSKNFTCYEDIPFKHFLICNKKSYDRADPKPYAYFFLNKEMTYIATLYADTLNFWEVKEIIDPIYGYSYKAYQIDKSFLEFRRVPNEINKMQIL